jgi:molecular chaperone DnaJ
MAAVKDYYKLLGVEKKAGLDDIKKAYRKLARKYHPDLNPGDKSAEQKFKDLSEAYAVLSDEEKRREYDNYGRSPFEGAGGFGPFGAGARGGSQTYSTFDFDFGDIFGDIFGRTASGGARQAVFRQGADIASPVEVTLEEAFRGVTKRMTYKREMPCNRCGATGVESSEYCPRCQGTGKTHISKGFFRVADRCSECGGTGRKTTKVCTDCSGMGKTFVTESVNVRIPAGVDNGSSVKLRGKGNGGLGGAPAGDLRLKVSVRPHELFERSGDDILIKLPVTFPEAALGAKVRVPTIDGSTMMTIPEATQGGRKFKLTGKGFARPGGRSRGDMYVTAAIAVPEKLGDDEREAIRKLASAYGEDPRKGLEK